MRIFFRTDTELNWYGKFLVRTKSAVHHSGLTVFHVRFLHPIGFICTILSLVLSFFIALFDTDESPLTLWRHISRKTRWW
jgi:hypothetical protein